MSSTRASLPAALVVSLDFELHWGVRDHTPHADFLERALATRRAIPRLLELFDAYGVHATWATVGLLFAQGRQEALRFAPRERPPYADPRLSPYADLEEAGLDEREDPARFAGSILDEIARHRHQEIASHTFSHFYCLAPGQTQHQFAADLGAAREIGRRFGDVCASLVFPRNQLNPNYLSVLRDLGVRAYRTQRAHWAYAPSESEPIARRLWRAADTYLPLSGSALAEWPRAERPIELTATHFLRPHPRKLALLGPLQVQRIARDLELAAANRKIVHLWWHPHNMAERTEAFLVSVETILWHFERLRRRTGIQSMNMGEVAQTVSESR